MSRVGKTPVEIPSGVKVSLTDGEIAIEGSKGKLQHNIPGVIEVQQEDGKLVFSSKQKDRNAQALYGTTRAIINNMVQGVQNGWKRSLELSGVGYTAALQGDKLELIVGLSHEVKLPVPEGVTCKVGKTTIDLESADKQKVGEFAAEIRRVRPPEPYLGKGIKYSDEQIRRKAGKAGK